VTGFWSPNESSSVSVTVLVGILIAIAGMYLTLAEHDADQESDFEGTATANAILQRFPITRSAVAQTLIFIGLATLGLSQSAASESTGRSILADGMRGTVFYLGACLSLAGAVGVVFSTSVRAVVLSAAVLGTGGATVLGVSGNTVVGGLLLVGAALCGWWLHSQNETASKAEFVKDIDLAESEPGVADSITADSITTGPLRTPEPLLTSVAIVLFCWLLGSTLQSAVHEGTYLKVPMIGSFRALPRAAFSVDAQRNDIPDTEATHHVENSSPERSRDDALFWCAVGLLAATIGLGYSRTDRKEPAH
jgi:hypothetical protein